MSKLIFAFVYVFLRSTLILPKCVRERERDIERKRNKRERMKGDGAVSLAETSYINLV